MREFIALLARNRLAAAGGIVLIAVVVLALLTPLLPLANPDVTIELGSERFDAVAIPAEGGDRDRLMEKMVADWPFFGEYQRRVERKIPVVRIRKQDR